MITNVRDGDCDKVIAAIAAVRALSSDNLAGLPLILLDRAHKQFRHAAVVARNAMFVRADHEEDEAKEAEAK